MSRPNFIAIGDYLRLRGYRGFERRDGRNVALGGDQSRAAEAMAAAEAAFPKAAVTDDEFEDAIADLRIDAVSDAHVAVAIAAAKLVAAAPAGESVAVEAVRATAKTDRRDSRRALR